MMLSQALALVRLEDQASRKRTLFLACGFQPLHLATFLRAHFVQSRPDEAADLQTGLYGDLPGNLAKAAASSAEAAAVVVEWSDLDPRLGLRSSGGFGPSQQRDIVATCQEGWGRLIESLNALVSRMPVALALPTLPTPLFGHSTGWQMCTASAELGQQAASFAVHAARLKNLRLVDPGRLALDSPPCTRLDPKMELGAGFPYSLAHSSALARHFNQLLYPGPPMKGLITDLDETLWSGIVGEIGVPAVNWSLTGHAQIHGLYQQQLRQLSELGVLLAIVSKNEAAIVAEALRRPDLYVSGEAFFPVHADWQRKSKGVARVLEAWNVSPDSVVVVDDSPMELDEIQAAFPSITCLRFPTGQPAATLDLLEQLRDLFGKPAIEREDALRRSSIGGNALFHEAAARLSPSEFIQGLQGKVTFSFSKDPSNRRPLELINKTNQFNLNGVRLSDGEWLKHLADPLGYVLTISYEDKFGPLGVVGVVLGRRDGQKLQIFAWVMSCRAFSRRIEFHTLHHLFATAGAPQITLAFVPTERNQPLQEFLKEVETGAEVDGVRGLSRKTFVEANHLLPHQTVVI